MDATACRRVATAGGVVRLVALASLVALAGCGGGQRKDVAAGAAADTTTPSAAPAPIDTAARDTAAKADTGMKADSAGMKADSARTQRAAPAKPKKASAPSSSKPAADTAATQTAATQTAATQTAAADAPLRDQYHQPPRDTVSQEVYDGWKQFNLNCARCHGEDVTGTTIAPHLIMSLKPDGAINTKELFVSTVCSGRPAKGMPAWCSLGLGMDKIQEIYSYVKGRSDGKLAPGRPAVRSQS